MLLYTDVVNTSVSVLNCPLLNDHDGELVSVRIMLYATAYKFSINCVAQ